MYFSVPWSIGAVLDVNSREKFNTFFRDLLHGKDEENQPPKILGKVDCAWPDNGLVYDYMYEVRRNHGNDYSLKNRTVLRQWVYVSCSRL